MCLQRSRPIHRMWLLGSPRAAVGTEQSSFQREDLKRDPREPASHHSGSRSATTPDSTAQASAADPLQFAGSFPALKLPVVPTCASRLNQVSVSGWLSADAETHRSPPSRLCAAICPSSRFPVPVSHEPRCYPAQSKPGNSDRRPSHSD